MKDPRGETTRDQAQPPRIFRTMAICRPFAKVVQLGKRVAAPPKPIGIRGIALGFTLLIGVGTLLLSLPMARPPETACSLLDALFTATSAVCVLGLVVDTGTHWSFFGQGVILGLMQLGGLGVMTASMFILIDETQLLTMALMHVGGATGSTAGRIKVTTLAVLVLATAATTRGYEHASAFGGRLSHQLIYRALAIAIFALAMVFLGTLALAITERFAFRQLLFEVVSAFATVGLSTGITPDLSMAGKLTIIAVMYLGRLGPLTLAYGLAQRAREPSYQLPERDVAIG